MNPTYIAVVSSRALPVSRDASILGRVGNTGGESRRSDATLALIGVFKLVKTAILLALGVAAFTGASGHIVHVVAHLTHWTGIFSGREVVQRALAKVLSLDERTIHRLGVASFCYAAIFATEGTGLLLKRHWAEWFTVVVTGSFVPIEVYELVHRPGIGKLAALVLNVAIVAYLAWRLRAERRHPSPGSQRASAGTT
jgi:uncharacterized membrane protein (DUF2068 family)